MRVNGILLVSSLCDVSSAIFSVDLLGAMFASGYSGVRVAAFFKKKNYSHLLLKSASSLQRRLSLRNENF